MNRIAILFVALAGLVSIPRASAQVQVIANPGVAASTVTSTELRDLFLGASSSLPGTGQLKPVMLSEGTVQEEFLSLYIGRSESAFRANWRSVVFSGQGSLPRTFENDASVVQYVASTPGAIGYISRGAPHAGAKVLTVR